MSRSPSTAAVDAVLDVIAGLDAAARAGILHRDVKPSNCFVDDDGRVKIGDLGISISAHVPDDSSQRATGMRVVGTPAYASPEQLRGHALDARSDIYGVGATLYELVTGHVPFEREDLMALLMAVANDAPRAPHLVNPAIPRGLSALILRCLAKEPERRYDSYDELAAALEAYSSLAPTAAPLSRRCVAGLIDVAILGLPLVAYTIEPLLAGGVDRGALSVLTTPLVGALTAWAYFSVFEGAWGASPGKWLSGLGVVAANGQPARLPPIIGRAALWALWLLSIRLVSSAEPPFLETDVAGSAGLSRAAGGGIASAGATPLDRPALEWPCRPARSAHRDSRGRAACEGPPAGAGADDEPDESRRRRASRSV